MATRSGRSALEADQAPVFEFPPSLQIQSTDDMGAGYIAAMTVPNKAAIQRHPARAKIAQAQAELAPAAGFPPNPAGN